MAQIRVSTRVDPAGVKRLLSGQDGAGGRAVVLKGQRVLNAARQLCPVDEGTLRASLTMEVVDFAGVPMARVGSHLEHAVYVHEGTGIYGPQGTRIYPKTARVMRWPVKNNSGTGARRRYRAGATAAFAYARSTKGMRGRPFLRDALVAAKG